MIISNTQEIPEQDHHRVLRCGELTSYTELLSDACGEAARLFRFAADQGDVFAQYNTFA